MPPRASHSPRSKEELLNKALSYDTGINLHALGDNISVVRTAPHIVRLTFPDTGKVFDLTVHMPRAEQKALGRVAEEWERPVSPRIAGRKH